MLGDGGCWGKTLSATDEVTGTPSSCPVIPSQASWVWEASWNRRAHSGQTRVAVSHQAPAGVHVTTAPSPNVVEPVAIKHAEVAEAAAWEK